MKAKKNVIFSSLLAIVLCLSMASGATFALFTSESAVNVAITSGTVSVTAVASDVKTLSGGVERTGELALTFENGGAVTHDKEGQSITVDKITPMDEVRFKLTVTNFSTVNVKYRTVIYVEEDEGLFEALKVTFADSEAELGRDTATAFDGETVTQAWSDLAPDCEDRVVYVSVAFPDGANQNKYQGLKTKLVYSVEAVQANAPAGTIGGQIAVTDEAALTKVLSAGGSAILGADVELGADLVIPAGVTATLDLNGKTLSAKDDATVSVAVVYNKGNLTVKNGTLEAVEATAIRSHGANASLTLNDVTVNQTVATDPEWLGSAVFTSGGATTVINSGSYTGVSSAAIVATSGGNLVINGGTFTADVSTLRVDSWSNNSFMTVNGGTINVSKEGAKAIYADGYKSVAVNGGTFNGAIDSTYSHIYLNGGTFTKSIKQAGGHQNYYVIGGGTYVDDLSVAITNTVVNGSVTDNGDGTYTVTMTADDLKGMLTAGGKVVIAGTVDMEGATVAIADGTTVMGGTVKNATLTVADEFAASFEGVTFDGTTTVAALGDGELSFKGCTFDSDPAKYGNFSRNSAIVGQNQYYTIDLTLEDCVFNYSENNGDKYNAAIFMWSCVKNVTVKNCEFNGYGFMAVKFMNVAEGAVISFENNVFNMSNEGDPNYYYNNAIQIQPQHDKTFTANFTDNKFTGDFEIIDGEECLAYIKGMSNLVLTKATVTHSGNTVNGEAAVDANFPVL